MKTYSFKDLFLPSASLAKLLSENPAELANWESQKQAAIAADVKGDRFKI